MRPLLAMMAVLLLFAVPVATAQGTAGNETGGDELPEDPLDGPARYTIDVFLGEAGANLVIHPADLTIGPGATVTFRVVNVGAVPHDFTFVESDFDFDDQDMREREDGGQAVKTPLMDPGEDYDLTVTFPDDYEGSVTYFCSVPGHRSAGMEGTLHVGAAAGEEEITEFGVDYLAYWVGIVSFIIIFVVLFGTFFLFRYGESKEVTDHRTGAAVTTAAGKAEWEGSTPEQETGFLPDPAKLAIFLSLLAILLWVLTEFTSIFGGA